MSYKPCSSGPKWINIIKIKYIYDLPIFDAAKFLVMHTYHMEYDIL